MAYTPEEITRLYSEHRWDSIQFPKHTEEDLARFAEERKRLASGEVLVPRKPITGMAAAAAEEVA